MDDDIIRMAREAGGEITSFINYDYGEDVVVFHMADLARFAALVAAAERERIKGEPNVEYERGFIDGMQMQTKSSVDRAVNRMAEPERNFCERCGKRLSQDGVHTCTPPQQIEQAMLGVWQDVPGAVNFGITDPAAPRCLYPDCVGGQSGTVCHKHCPTPCPDCRGIGYDASGQLCACQENPSFG